MNKRIITGLFCHYCLNFPAIATTDINLCAPTRSAQGVTCVIRTCCEQAKQCKDEKVEGRGKDPAFHADTVCSRSTVSAVGSAELSPLGIWVAIFLQ